MSDLRVWHIPQIPGKPFFVDVSNLAEAVHIRNLLAEYDEFQFRERIKPDYSSVSGIVRLESDGDWDEVDKEEYEQYEERRTDGLVVDRQKRS